MFNNFFFFENRAVYEIMWTNMVQVDSPHITWRMRIACWIPKATNTHTHTHNMKYLLLFHGNNGYTNAPQWYVIRTLPVLLTLAVCDDKW